MQSSLIPSLPVPYPNVAHGSSPEHNRLCAWTTSAYRTNECKNCTSPKGEHPPHRSTYLLGECNVLLFSLCTLSLDDPKAFNITYALCTDDMMMHKVPLFLILHLGLLSNNSAWIVSSTSTCIRLNKLLFFPSKRHSPCPLTTSHCTLLKKFSLWAFYFLRFFSTLSCGHSVVS